MATDNAHCRYYFSPNKYLFTCNIYTTRKTTMLIAVLVIILLLVLFFTSRQHNRLELHQGPPRSILRYQRVLGTGGKIYSVDIISDGRYEVSCLHGRVKTMLKQGMLPRSHRDVVIRLLYKPPKPCMVDTVAADSTVSTLSYPLSRQVVYLGTLDADKLQHASYHDVAAIDMMLPREPLGQCLGADNCVERAPVKISANLFDPVSTLA